MTLDVMAPADPLHYDGEINEQVVPEVVWGKLVHRYRHAHATDFHRARFMERFLDYLQGVADGIELDADDLLERIKEVA